MVQCEGTEGGGEPDLEPHGGLLGGELQLLQDLVTGLAPDHPPVVPPRRRQVDEGGGHVGSIRLEDRPGQ